jgi:hypothetical protein
MIDVQMLDGMQYMYWQKYQIAILMGEIIKVDCTNVFKRQAQYIQTQKVVKIHNWATWDK